MTTTSDRSLWTLGALAMTAAVLCLPAAAGAQPGPLAAVQTGGNTLSFSPNANYGGMSLTVTGGGKWWTVEFGEGEAPFFRLADEAGPLADGHYKWELTAKPAANAIDPSRYGNARSAFDGRSGDSARAPRLPIQSGSFRVSGGSIVDASAIEPGGAGGGGSFDGGGGGGPRQRGAAGPIANDQVILDDLIVDGSICAGLDCVNGESFGFDTLRLKENNLRIKFLDTSSTASFPTNDWELTANESSNGGQEKFSITDVTNGKIPFTVEGNSPSNSLYVDSSGKIGIKTSTPVVDLHIKSGNTPTVRLEQDGSSGFTAQTWDLAGNETNFFVRDATNGSKLPLRIRPDAPSNSIFVDTDGDIGIGTASPDADLDITDSGTANIKFASTGGNGQIWNLQTDAGSNNFAIRDASGTAANVFVIEEGFDAEIMRLNASGQVVVQGTPVHPDYVFEPDYALESIEDHAEFMFTQKHLPAVGAGTYTEDGKPFISLGDRSQGMLEELEKAHVYIAQLNERLAARESTIDAMGEAARQRDAALEELRLQLAELQGRLPND